ncbi:hypothetical protein AKJ40_01335 [candidate division MSBL1 archaeon SCGC-AAA259M10]|uniref:Uncharacterized protein n=1 Tax=candidate division MSBL1 archaeon SCGC-AAA259M10 TaxID=1698270 RepID=A0A133V1T7_9EURY|nr:hypothetical protein AKJ40_01335 [candidate division MSBL1 archaeon SCGC-AAA259M10]
MPKYEGVVFPLYTEMIKKGVKDGKDVFAKFSRRDVASGMDLYLYGSGDNGAKKIIAKAEVKASDSLKPNEVWEKYNERLFQHKEDFDDYTSNRRNKEMLVLELENLQLLDEPIEIPTGKNMTVAGLYVDEKMKKKLL